MENGEEKAFWDFVSIRWDGYGPECPSCQGHGFYWLETRQKFRCKTCGSEYSPTKGTPFESHKFTYSQLIDIMTEVGGKKPRPHSLWKRFGGQYKTWWMISKKLEASGFMKKCAAEGE